MHLTPPPLCSTQLKCSHGYDHEQGTAGAVASTKGGWRRALVAGLQSETLRYNPKGCQSAEASAGEGRWDAPAGVTKRQRKQIMGLGVEQGQDRGWREMLVLGPYIWEHLHQPLFKDSILHTADKTSGLCCGYLLLAGFVEERFLYSKFVLTL